MQVLAGHPGDHHGVLEGVPGLGFPHRQPVGRAFPLVLFRIELGPAEDAAQRLDGQLAPPVRVERGPGHLAFTRLGLGVGFVRPVGAGGTQGGRVGQPGGVVLGLGAGPEHLGLGECGGRGLVSGVRADRLHGRGVRVRGQLLSEGEQLPAVDRGGHRRRQRDCGPAPDRWAAQVELRDPGREPDAHQRGDGGHAEGDGHHARIRGHAVPRSVAGRWGDRLRRAYRRRAVAQRANAPSDVVTMRVNTYALRNERRR